MPTDVLELFTSAMLPVPGTPPSQLPAVSHAPPLLPCQVAVFCAVARGTATATVAVARADATSLRRFGTHNRAGTLTLRRERLLHIFPSPSGPPPLLLENYTI